MNIYPYERKLMLNRAHTFSVLEYYYLSTQFFHSLPHSYSWCIWNRVKSLSYVPIVVTTDELYMHLFPRRVELKANSPKRKESRRNEWMEEERHQRQIHTFLCIRFLLNKRRTFFATRRNINTQPTSQPNSIVRLRVIMCNWIDWVSFFLSFFLSLSFFSFNVGIFE